MSSTTIQEKPVSLHTRTVSDPFTYQAPGDDCSAMETSAVVSPVKKPRKLTIVKDSSKTTYTLDGSRSAKYGGNEGSSILEGISQVLES